MINKRLTIVGLESDDNEIIENQKKIQEYEEEERVESENSEYEDTDMGELNNRHEIEDENEDSTNERIEERMKENENVDEIQVQPQEIKTKGRPKGTTKAMMEIRKNLRKEEKKREQENVRRSKRIKEQQSAMIIIDKDIPKNVQEAEKSKDWKYWRQAIKEELTSMKKHGLSDIEPQSKDKRVIKCKYLT